MGDISIRFAGCTGRITLQRPKALNALTYDMLIAIERALDEWRANDAVKLVIIDAEGEKAFCAGGDIAQLYATGKAGDFAYGRTFWADEYRVNDKIAEYPKPYVAFMQGFTMGGGVGVGCHGKYRIVGESSQIAMPECGIGLVPDVGGSLLLAHAPGRAGEYLGTTGARMDAGDAIYAGFADSFVPEANWQGLIEELEQSGNPGAISTYAIPAPTARLSAHQSDIDLAFSGESLADIEAALSMTESNFANESRKSLRRNSPLSMAVAVAMVRQLRRGGNIRDALELEYRYTYRAMESGDFIEGIRAQIIDKDRNPQWRHRDVGSVPRKDIEAMLAPLGEKGLKLKQEEPV